MSAVAALPVQSAARATRSSDESHHQLLALFPSWFCGKYIDPGLVSV